MGREGNIGKMGRGKMEHRGDTGGARGEEMELRDNRDSVYDMNYEISVGFQ